MGPQLTEQAIGVRWSVAVRGGGPGSLILGLQIWYVARHLSGGEGAGAFVRYQLDVAKLTSVHSSGSGTSSQIEWGELKVKA